MIAVVASLSLILAVVQVIGGGPSDTASAANAQDYNAGNIISDANFYDSNALTAAQVQSFLNQRVPTCHPEWDSKPEDITCLKDYRTTTVTKSANAYCSGYQGGLSQSAAQIIDGVARSCGISQKVLLVMLQKEQGLVNNVYPSSYRYRSAMGMGCPDTSACDAQYYGFFNQVYGAAQQYKIYQAKPSSYAYRAGRNNYIQWSPNASCGGSTVYIQNQATAALYIYTPYRPNAAALAAGYGGGDGCSTYGNRNFFLYYSDWFGSPTQSPAVVGNVDELSVQDTNAGASLRVRGWTYDPDSPASSIQLHAYVTRVDDGSRAGTPVAADLARSDVNAAFNITGNHGFDAMVPITKPGTYQICLYGVNGSRNTLLTCQNRTLAGQAAPQGSFDELTLSENGNASGLLTVRGWAYDPATSTTSIPVHVYVTRPDGTTAGYSAINGTPTTANQPRPDVNNAFTITGNHGYNFQIPITQTGTYKVCTYAIGTNWRNTGNNPQIGCKTLTTGTTGAPRGSFDELSLISNNALNVRGWAYDPVTSTTSIPVHVYVTRPDGTTAGYSAINGTPTTANQPRPDVNNAFTITGNHGYNFQIPITQTGTYKVCTYAIGTNWRNTGNNPQIGCKVATKK